MPELTEQVHPLDLLKAIPERAWTAVVNALVVGFDKYGVWDSSESRARYVRSAQNHLTALRKGETYDAEDHHHHAAAIVVRALQILDAECKEG